MARDYWENDMIFVTEGKRYGLNPIDLHTVWLGPVKPPEETSQPLPEPEKETKKVVLYQPKPVVTDNSLKTCIVCQLPFTSKREDAKFCSPRCRQVASRKNRQLELLKV